MGKRKLPGNYDAFYREYEALCRKHNLMVLSDGEEVTIGKADKNLWGVKKSTLDKIELQKK